MKRVPHGPRPAAVPRGADPPAAWQTARGPGPAV